MLAFAARRLLAEPVGLIFAAREPGEQFRGLPDLEVRGLPDKDARALLASAVRVRLDEQVWDRIVAETNGNPLALLELPRGLSPAQLAGGFGLAGAQPVPARIEQGFRERLAALPGDTRSLMLIAAAEPTGDPVLMWRAAGRLGIAASAAEAAQADGLLETGPRVRFRHPLVRSAVYSSASPPERRAAHQALAEVTDPGRDPDRRVWHLAAAAPGPDEEVAAELERSAGRAQARGGMAAAAAFLRRAVELTAEPARRSERAVAAAQASLLAGALDAATDLLAMAAAGPLDELQQARVSLLRGQLAFASSMGGDAPALLVKAAQQLEPLDAVLARQTYLDAWAAALFAGQFAGAGSLHEVARAARSAPPPAAAPRLSDLLLDGLAALVTEGRARAAPLLRQAARVFAEDEITVEEGLRYGWLATTAAAMVWEDEYRHATVARQLQSVREAGLLVHLPLWVQTMAIMTAWRGDFAAAASLIAEAEAITAATGSGYARYAAVFLAGLRGAEAEAWPLIEAVITDSRAAGQGVGVQWSQWVSAILYNSLGRYEEARAEAQQAAEQAPELNISMWALAELIEAASRTGQTRLAADALARLAEATGTGPSDWGQGIFARCRALLLDGAGRRGLLSRGGRPAEPHSPSSRARPRAPAVRRVAAPGGPAGRRAGAAAHRARDVSTRSAWRRSPSGPAASCWPPGRPSASAPSARTTSSPRKRPRSRGWPGRACPTRRSPPSCSCPRGRSNGTCARFLPSSRSAPAGSSSRRCPMGPAPGRWHNRPPGREFKGVVHASRS